MSSEGFTPEVRDWLTANGWSPGRDIGDHAEELIQVRVQDAQRQGIALTPMPAAVHVIHTFGLLHLTHPTAQDISWITAPTLGYEGDARAIQELAFGLGTELFPIGYESSEYGILLIDERGRFFHLHHTGGYYLGENTADTFSRFLIGAPDPDAEDFFA
ncbi:SUKH-3 domain-containing protein [Streptomyces sp. Ncost-T10-10d]|uniref:SUKH-3 domain-containing protein n=1 Tax=Streptomyces sp. Ncost-T10-10d TaxID=1839774 RepID=UPI00081DF7B5|nr:SUKH-3 domain-containing protein [Streptomyces sp. Ncost-T10-10d]SCF57858.1 SUKH-3 immunity protein [Streptomyces sp. Ncost-T10-10d]